MTTIASLLRMFMHGVVVRVVCPNEITVEWFRIWQTVVSCVPRVYEVVGNSANCRIVRHTRLRVKLRSSCEFGEVLYRVYLEITTELL